MGLKSRQAAAVIITGTNAQQLATWTLRMERLPIKVNPSMNTLGAVPPFWARKLAPRKDPDN